MVDDLDGTFRNVVQQLQADPLRYKLFGIYWWAIKAMLKEAGFGPDQLYMLGSYTDPECAARMPKMGLQDTLEAALLEYGQNARYGRPGGRVEDADGEIVTIYDSDAGQ